MFSSFESSHGLIINREFQGSTPRCLGPNPDPYPHNTCTRTPEGVGHSHRCRGVDPPWVYPRVGHLVVPSHSQIHRKKYRITITIYNKITTFMQALSVSHRHHCHCLAMAFAIGMVSSTSSCWHHCHCCLHHAGAGVGAGVGAGKGAGGVLNCTVTVILQGQGKGKVQAVSSMVSLLLLCRGRARQRAWHHCRCHAGAGEGAIVTTIVMQGQGQGQVASLAGVDVLVSSCWCGHGCVTAGSSRQSWQGLGH